MLILFFIGGTLILWGAYLFLKGIWKLLLAAYYWNIAKDDALDQGFKKHVIGNTEEYKEFQKT